MCTWWTIAVTEWLKLPAYLMRLLKWCVLYTRKSNWPVEYYRYQTLNYVPFTFDFSWAGRYVWGVAYKDLLLHSEPPSPAPSSPKPSIVMSSSENPAVQDALRSDFTLVDAAGAGYKILCVADELVDLYLLTKGSTFKWDTCAPQPVLLAQRGGLLDYSKALGVVKAYQEAKEEDLFEMLARECSVVYNKMDREGAEAGQEWSNAGGIIAYRDIKVVVKMLKKLCPNSSQ